MEYAKINNSNFLKRFHLPKIFVNIIAWAGSSEAERFIDGLVAERNAL